MQDLTLEDIAKEVGVSRSTVSRVVNGHPNVSEKVRKRVLKVIQNKNFHPNQAARSLASQRTSMIGLVLPHSVSAFFTDPYFPHLTQGIAYGCNNNDLTLALFLIGNREDEEKIYPRISRRGLLDGILIQSGAIGDHLIDRISKSNMPSLIIGRPADMQGVSFIDVDNEGAAFAATNHLIKLGYRNIGMINGRETDTTSIDRKAGFLKAIQSAGRSARPEMIINGDFMENGGFTAMGKLFPYQPDAIFAASDLMAIGAMRAVQEAGLKIPDDIAFVGFDDLPVATMSNIKLSTVRQPIARFGVKAVEVLIDLIENGTQPARRMIFDTELIIRDSCGAAKIFAKTK